MQNSAHSALRLWSPDQYNLADYMSHLANVSFCNKGVPSHGRSSRCGKFRRQHCSNGISTLRNYLLHARNQLIRPNNLVVDHCWALIPTQACRQGPEHRAEEYRLLPSSEQSS